jgi:predicted DNA-binding protein (MmcQ/YjbR family)
MNIDSIRAYCLSFPDTKEQLQWGDVLVFKVRGKIFTMVNLEVVDHRVIFKCTPEQFAELCEREGLWPSPYVGRYNWIAVESFDTLPDEELRELIRQSYDMVSAKAPRRIRKKPRPRRRAR